jgi:hypothetical protein
VVTTCVVGGRDGEEEMRFLGGDVEGESEFLRILTRVGESDCGRSTSIGS